MEESAIDEVSIEAALPILISRRLCLVWVPLLHFRNVVCLVFIAQVLKSKPIMCRCELYTCQIQRQEGKMHVFVTALNILV